MRHVIVLLALSITTLACGKHDDSALAAPSSSAPGAAPAADESTSKDALIEDHEGGSVAWTITKDGQAKAIVNATGDAKAQPATGTLTWKANATDAPRTIPLAADANGALVASGPALSADITEIGYALDVSGKSWTGTLHVPAGGTAQLAADAKAAVEVKVPDGKVGPHGGKIQIIGGDRIEIVSDPSGEVRVYVLDADFKPIAVGDRKVTIAVVAERPEVVVVTPDASGLYFTGTLHVHEDPFKLTVAVRSGEHVSVALCGWHPGAHVVVVGPSAPRVSIHTKVSFNAHADVHGHDDDDGVKVKVKGPSINVKIGGDDDHGKHKGHKH